MKRWTYIVGADDTANALYRAVVVMVCEVLAGNGIPQPEVISLFREDIRRRSLRDGRTW